MTDLPVAPAPHVPGAIQAPQLGWQGQVGAARVALHEAINDRDTADLRVTYAWVALFFAAPFIHSAMLGFAWFVFLASFNIVLLLIFGGLAFLTTSLIHGVINRRLIKRMTRHFARESRMRIALIEYLHAKAAEQGKLADAASALLSMASIHGEAQTSDKGRSTLWSFAVALPGIRWYFFWFISKFPYEHEQRWLRFMQYTEVAAKAIGVPFAMPAVKPVKRHNFWLFLFLSLITSNWFTALWYVIMIREPHKHFESHLQVDDAIMVAFH